MPGLKVIGLALVAVLGLLTLPNLARSSENSAGIEYGGPFELIDHNGRTVTNRDFLGHFMLIYFGYTHCPDICPTSLSRMAATLERLGERAQAIQPIFISLDTRRDTPERMASYVAAFHPRLIGLSGSLDAIDAAAAAYSVRFFAGDIDGKYMVGHTGYFYLVGPDGEFLERIADGITPDDLAARLLQYLDRAAD
jgi:protein SCO1/2